MTALLLHLVHVVHLPLVLARRRDDRGDVPGWVMIAVMTAGLCTALYVVARGQLSDLLSGALHDVTNGR